MKFLVDADLPKSTAEAIIKLGFYAEDVRNIGLGNEDDTKIIEYAKQNDFIIITRDLGFGNIHIYPIKFHKGVIILRLPNFFITKQINKILLTFLNLIKEKSVKEEQIKNSIVIVELGRYRIRR